MFLDLEINNKVISIEFLMKEIIEKSEFENEWLLESIGNLENKFELRFREKAFILNEVLFKPIELITQSDVLSDLINELLKKEYEKRAEGFDESDEGKDADIQPYDPKKISIRNERWSLSHVFELIDKYDYIDLSPDFQRNFVWDIKRRSQLIESLMLRIPVPAFYLSETGDGKFQVVDGLQRLTTIRDFMRNEFYLRGLEYLTEQDGRFFKDEEEEKKKGIDNEFVITINLTQINVNIIESKSPSKVKFDVFRRVNTGGKPLNNQEIRNCLAGDKTRKLINELANMEEFKIATGESVRTTRMQAQEIVLRFISFYNFYVLNQHSINWRYKGNMTEYLDTSVELINENKVANFDELKIAFSNSMKSCYHLFGQYAFRKCLPKDLEEGARKQLVNKSLFTTWSVLLSKYDPEVIKKHIEFESFAKILAVRLSKNSKFLYSVSYKTNDRISLELAFKETKKIIEENILI